MGFNSAFKGLKQDFTSNAAGLFLLVELLGVVRVPDKDVQIPND